MLKTAFLLIILLVVVGVAFWFLMPSKTPSLIINDQKQTASSAPSEIDQKIGSLQDRLNTLESSNSALQSKVSKLESSKSKSSTKTSGTSQKTPVLIPINPGGEGSLTDWLNLISGSITIDPKDYAGYKAAYLIVNLSVYQGQGKAFARLVNAGNGLAILDSEVSTSSDTPVRLMSKAFKLPEGSFDYTVQLKTLTQGYPAQAADSFLQITY